MNRTFIRCLAASAVALSMTFARNTEAQNCKPSPPGATAENVVAWAWGSNNSGELGDGTTFDRHIPVRVQNLTGILAVAAPLGTAVSTGNACATPGFGISRVRGFISSCALAE
jgi:Regulator of chromosome condensation (RCC1) repeat